MAIGEIGSKIKDGRQPQGKGPWAKKHIPLLPKPFLGPFPPRLEGKKYRPVQSLLYYSHLIIILHTVPILLTTLGLSISLFSLVVRAEKVKVAYVKNLITLLFIFLHFHSINLL